MRRARRLIQKRPDPALPVDKFPPLRSPHFCHRAVTVWSLTVKIRGLTGRAQFERS